MKLSEMKQILVEGEIQLTKSLGQNFLHDANQLRRIVDLAELRQPARVLEIGPGLGPLTELLLEEAGTVLAIEKDARLVEVLKRRFQNIGNPNHEWTRMDTNEHRGPYEIQNPKQSPESLKGGNPGTEAGQPLTPAPPPGSSSEQGEEKQKTPHPSPLPVGRGEGGARGGSSRVNQAPGQCTPALSPSAGAREERGANDRGAAFSEPPWDVPGLHLIHDDALEYLKRAERDWSGWKLVANLPYSVASPILVELALARRGPERMVATLQIEVAKRLMAGSGDEDYGVLTLLVQLEYQPQGWFKIPANCFFPAPDVDSACVCLARREQALLAPEYRSTFTRLVKLGFSQRRKMMLKLLKQNWNAPALEQAFQMVQLSPQVRAESVSLEQFAQLARVLHETD